MILAASILAWLLVGLGVLRTAMGFLVAFTFEDNSAAAGRYLAAANTGEAINEGLMWIAAGIVLGVLVSISKNLESINRKLSERGGD